jgi:hypothetical protein
VGHVTLSAIKSKMSTRGRKPRLDLQKSWVDGDRTDQRWNWSAYVLRVDERWRVDEKITRRLRRSWRSRSEKGTRIFRPRLIEKVEPPPVVVKNGEATSTKCADGLGWCLLPSLHWMRCKYEKCLKTLKIARGRRISPFVGASLQDDRAWGRRPASRPRPQARPPPKIARPPPEAAPFRGQDVLEIMAFSTSEPCRPQRPLRPLRLCRLRPAR